LGGFLVVGGTSFGLGALPSREVALAIPQLVVEIADRIRRFRSLRRIRAIRTGEEAACASR
jgi:hypothetical protein